MKNLLNSLVLMACVFAAGCTSTRSISNSGYEEPQRGLFARPPQPSGSDPAFQYRGELSEFDVLGITRGEGASENDIRHALDDAKPVRLRRDSSILLIQSGAMFPDAPMTTELEKHFRVVPFSGVPPQRHVLGDPLADNNDPESFYQSLRLAAARSGSDVIICYWGTLETASEELATRTVSWVPVVSWIIPDEAQRMRIQLKMALIDVRTGNWSLLSPPPPPDSERLSTRHGRGATDQKQVESLKAAAYKDGVAALVRSYSEIPVAANQ